MQYLRPGDLEGQGVTKAEAKLVEALVGQLLASTRAVGAAGGGASSPRAAAPPASASGATDALAMLRAVGASDAAGVASLLRGGYPADLGVGGVPPLFSAALKGDARIVALLAEAGAALDLAVATRAAGGSAALAAAAQLGHVAVVDELLSRGAQCDAQRLDGATALFVAAEAGRTDCVRALCAHGASAAIAREADRATPLTIACELGRFDVADVLVAEGTGCDVDGVLADGATALFLAAQGGFTGIVRLLLDCGARPDAARVDGATPLLIARQVSVLYVPLHFTRILLTI